MVEVRERTNHSFTGEKPPEQTDIQEAIHAGTPLRGVLPLFNPDSGVIPNDISPFLFVIPGLTRNPVPSWIPAYAPARRSASARRRGNDRVCSD